jgi:ABC-type Fe3+/spermidine/putrescine transport system ATPase subunit
MNEGKVSQIAGPAELYEHPANRFVADFIGKVNLIEARVKGERNGNLILSAKALGEVEVPSDKPAKEGVTLAVRPEKLKLASSEPHGDDLIALPGKVRDVAYYGDTSHVIVTGRDGLELSINVQNDSRAGGTGVKQGQDIWVSWLPRDTLVLTE